MRGFIVFSLFIVCVCCDPYITYIQPSRCDEHGCFYDGSIEGLTVKNHSLSMLSDKFNGIKFDLLDWFDRFHLEHVFDFDLPSVHIGVCGEDDFCVKKGGNDFVFHSVGEIFSLYNVTGITPVRRGSITTNSTTELFEVVDGGDVEIGNLKIGSIYEYNVTSPYAPVGSFLVIKKSHTLYTPMKCNVNTSASATNASLLGLFKIDPAGRYYDVNKTLVSDLISTGVGTWTRFLGSSFSYMNRFYEVPPPLYYGSNNTQFSGNNYTCQYVYRTYITCTFTGSDTIYFMVNTSIGEFLIYGTNETKGFNLTYPTVVLRDGLSYYSDNVDPNSGDNHRYDVVHADLVNKIMPRSLSHEVCYQSYCPSGSNTVKITSQLGFTSANLTKFNMTNNAQSTLSAGLVDTCVLILFQPPTQWVVPEPQNINLTNGLQANMLLSAYDISEGGGSTANSNTSIVFSVVNSGVAGSCINLNVSLVNTLFYRWRVFHNSTAADQVWTIIVRDPNFPETEYPIHEDPSFSVTVYNYNSYFDITRFGLTNLDVCFRLTSFSGSTDAKLVTFGPIETVNTLFNLDTTKSVIDVTQTCYGGYVQLKTSVLKVNAVDPATSSVDLTSTFANCKNVPFIYSGDAALYSIDVISPRTPTQKRSVASVGQVDQIYSMEFSKLALNPDNDTSIPLSRGYYPTVDGKKLYIDSYFREVGEPGLLSMSLHGSPIDRLKDIDECSVMTVKNVTVLCRMSATIVGDSNFEIVLGVNVNSQYSYDEIIPIYLNKTSNDPWYSIGNMDTAAFWKRVTAVLIVLIIFIVGICVFLGPIVAAAYYFWMIICVCFKGAKKSAGWTWFGCASALGCCNSAFGWCCSRVKREYNSKFKPDEPFIPMTHEMTKNAGQRSSGSKNRQKKTKQTTQTTTGGGGRMSGVIYTTTLCCIVACCIPISEAVCSGSTLAATNVTTCVDGVCDLKLHLLASMPLTSGAEYCVTYDSVDTNLGSVVSDSVEIRLAVNNVTVEYPLLWQYYTGGTTVVHKTTCECPNGNNHYCTSSHHPSSLDCPYENGCAYVSAEGSNNGCGIYLVGNGHYCTMAYPVHSSELSILKFQQQPTRKVCFLLTITSSVSSFTYDFCWDGVSEHDEVISSLPGRVDILGSYDSDYLQLGGNFLIRSKTSSWISSLVNQVGESTITKDGWAQVTDPLKPNQSMKYSVASLQSSTTLSPKSCGDAKASLSFAYRDIVSDMNNQNQVATYTKPYGVADVRNFGPTTTFRLTPHSGPNSEFEFVLNPGTIKYSIDAACPVIDKVSQSVIFQDGYVGYLFVEFHSDCGDGQIQVRATSTDPDFITGDDCIKMVTGPTNCTIPIQGTDNTTVVVVAQGYFTSVNVSYTVTVLPPEDIVGDITTQDDSTDGTNSGGHHCWLCLPTFHTWKDILISIVQLIMLIIFVALFVFIIWQIFRFYKMIKSVSQRKHE